MTGNRGQAQELTQETFLRAYRGLLRGESWENPRAWLYKTASRLAIDAYRRQRLFQWLPLSAGAAESEVAGVALDYIEVRTALDALPLKYRIPLLLYTCEGYSVVEVAKVLGLSPAAVKMRLCRARVMFRQAYAPEESR